MVARFPFGAVLPFKRELLDECGLNLVNPLDQATHVAGATLDLV